MVKPNPQQTKKHAVDPKAVLEGDRRAFEAWVRQESPRLYRMIVRILGDEDEARSVMQETFLQAYKRLHTFRGEAKLTTWLYAIGLNQARAARRKLQRFHTLEEADIERLQPQFRMGMYVERYARWSPERLAELSERQHLVRQAIDRLPDDYRLVIILRDIEELSTAEAARILELSDGAVRVRLHRARQALRALLDSHFGTGS